VSADLRHVFYGRGLGLGWTLDLGRRPFTTNEADALAYYDMMCQDDTILDALYGDDRVRINSDMSVTKSERAWNGFFGHDRSRGRNRRVTGVAVIGDFAPWSPESADITLFENPYAKHAFIDDLLPISRRFTKIRVVDSNTAEWGWLTEERHSA
jgi:hypothetical protein